MKVKNKNIIRRLTWRNMKAERFRNIMAVFAIALTAMLFTTIATMGGAILQSFEENTFRRVGTSAHGGYKYLNEEQYEKIVAAGGYEDISYDIILGFGTNPEFINKQHELRYAEDDKARWAFSYPTTGRMPEAFNEIALSTITLDLLGLPHQLGQTVHLEFMAGDTPMADDFTLVGFWPGDAISAAAQCYLSKEYVRTYAPDLGEKTDALHYSGAINADVYFRSSSNIEAKMNALTTAAGLNPNTIKTGINWSYIGSEPPDLISTILLAFMLFIIMLAGYLIIYSIFAISVSGDIRFYGLLKTIGTTGRQIKRIVRGQALLLSVIGIPLGLMLGFLLGTKLAPTMMRMLVFDMPTSIKARPLLFIFSALFSLVTVFISCQKPGKMAAKVSPIEALRYTEAGADTTKEKKKKEKKARKVSPAFMAWRNISRSKRKLVTVLLSLSLSLVLLNSVTSLVDSFNMDVYLENQIMADFYFTNPAILNPALSAENKNFEAIPEELPKEAAALPGFEGMGNVFYHGYSLPVSAETSCRLNEILLPYATSPPTKLSLENVMTENIVPLQIYGVDKFAFEKIQDNFSKISWDTFISGDYILLNTYSHSAAPESALYDVGDKITLEGANGTPKEFEVLGHIDYPYAMSSQFTLYTDSAVVLPSEKFLSFFGERPPFSFLLDVDESAVESTTAWAESFTKNRANTLTYRSKSYYENEFFSMKNTFAVLGNVLAFILALIGILNFINTMVTSVMTRRRELAMLQSVGMTNAQLNRQLFFEGLWYALLTLALTATVGTGISIALIQGVASTIWFFRFSFSIVPLLICTPVLIVLCAVIPLLCGRTLRKESIVTRLREN